MLLNRHNEGVAALSEGYKIYEGLYDNSAQFITTLMVSGCSSLVTLNMAKIANSMRNYSHEEKELESKEKIAAPANRILENISSEVQKLVDAEGVKVSNWWIDNVLNTAIEKPNKKISHSFGNEKMIPFSACDPLLGSIVIEYPQVISVGSKVQFIVKFEDECKFPNSSEFLRLQFRLSTDKSAKKTIEATICMGKEPNTLGAWIWFTQTGNYELLLNDVLLTAVDVKSFIPSPQNCSLLTKCDIESMLLFPLAGLTILG